MMADDILAENRQLKVNMARLVAENAMLTRKLATLEQHKTLARGIQGESLVADLINGVVTTHNASHDIGIRGRKLRIEVKYAALNSAVRGRGSQATETRRWAWSKPFGEAGNKVYDQLILVGDQDLRHAAHYKDANCPYVLFDIPYSHIMPLTIQNNGGRYRAIQLTT